MRITFATVNRNVQRNLSTRYESMVRLQEQLATGKRLTKPSDDPVDVANDIKLRTKQSQISQYKRNIQDGLANMGIASSAMNSMNELLHRARELAVQAANGTYTDIDRTYMQQEVNQLFRQMMTVINTQFKGNYIFNGTNTKTPPYLVAASGSTLTDFTNRTMATYGQEFDISLRDGMGHDPSDAMYLQYNTTPLIIGDTVQLAWSSTATPDIDGSAVNNIMLDSFKLDTYSIGADTFVKGADYDFNYTTGKLTILSDEFRDALNKIDPADKVTATGIDYNTYSNSGTGGITYSLSNTFQIVEGKWGDTIKDIFPGSFSIKIGAKEYLEGTGEYKPGYTDELGAYHKGENEFDYSVDYETGKITIYNMDLMRDMRPIWQGGPDSAVNPNAPDNLYVYGQLQINFDYITRGTDVYGEKVTSQGNIWRGIEEGVSVTINMGADEMLRDKKTGVDMVGTLLRYSQALLKDDRQCIQNALDELTTMYDVVLNAQSDMGARIYRLELTLTRNDDMNLEVSTQQSNLEDADLAEVISRLMLAENVYSASLQAAMKVIQPSLANYM